MRRRRRRRAFAGVSRPTALHGTVHHVARLLEAIDGPCLGRLLAFPDNLPALVTVVGTNGRFAVHAVRGHPRAVGSYQPDARRPGCARFYPSARSAA